MGLAADSAAAMFYVGLYQSRAVRRLWCPIFNKGCEAVADAAFAKPFGIPDGYIAVAYAAMILLLLALSRNWIWIPLLILASLAMLANFLGVRNMANLGSFCFYYGRPQEDGPSEFEPFRCEAFCSSGPKRR
jgi:uncharacterized membrane protein